MIDIVTATPKPISVGIALLSLTVVGTVDFFTAFDVSFSVFYALIVIFVVWSLGRVAGVFVAVLTVAVWSLVEIFSGHSFSNHWVPLWNSAVRLSFLVLVVAGAYHTKRHVEITAARNNALEQILPVCTCCKKISDERGAWMDMETYLSEYTSSRPTIKLCPDCAKRLYMSKVLPAADPAAKA